MKYVIINESVPMLFPDYKDHAEFRHFGNITSAGFVRFYKNGNGEIRSNTYGKSLSLRIGQDTMDSVLIDMLIRV